MALFSYDNPPYKWDPNIIKVIRRLAGVTVMEMAILLRIPEYYYEEIESGKASPDLNELIRIADFSGGSLDYLTGRVQDPETLQDKLRIAKTALYEKYLEHGSHRLDFYKTGPAWPYNLFEVILGETINEPLTDDQLEALDDVLRELEPREQDCILKYFKEEKKYIELGKEYGLTASRIQQIVQDGITHCKRYNNRAILKYGKKGYGIRKETNKLESKKRYYTRLVEEVEKKQEEYEKALERLRLIEKRLEVKQGRKVESFEPCSYDPDLDIGDLDLSVRSYNCLKRAGINTLGDLANKTYEDMMKVRNLGKKSLDEILDKLAEMNIQLSPSEEAPEESPEPSNNEDGSQCS